MNAQVVLHMISIIVSIAGIIGWVIVARADRRLQTAVWWPISLLVSNALFSLVALIDLTLVDILSNVTLNYWGQGVRIQMAVTLVVTTRLMYNALKIQRRYE